MAKLETYREKIFNIGNVTTNVSGQAAILIDPKNGPIQRVNLSDLADGDTVVLNFVTTKLDELLSPPQQVVTDFTSSQWGFWTGCHNHH